MDASIQNTQLLPSLQSHFTVHNDPHFFSLVPLNNPRTNDTHLGFHIILNHSKLINGSLSKIIGPPTKLRNSSYLKSRLNLRKVIL
jgi:hypothetical protein